MSKSLTIEYRADASYRVVETSDGIVTRDEIVRWTKPKSESFLFNIIDHTEPDSPRKQYEIACNKLMHKAYTAWCVSKNWKPDSLARCEKEFYPELFPSYEQRMKDTI
jgi:hypothetical protein